MASRSRFLRVAPGTAYTAGQDVGGNPNTLTPRLNCELDIEVAVSAATILYERLNSVNLELNDGVPLSADRVYRFTILGGPADTISFRFADSVTLRKFVVDEVFEGSAS